MTLTPEQFNILATKDDLNDLEERVLSKTASKEGLNTVLSAIDGLTKMVKDFQAEMASNQAAHDRLEYKTVSLEKRVLVLEEK